MRIRAELFDNVLDVGAVPMIDIHAVYTSVIQPNLASSSTPPTTSATTVSAAGPATLTLASVAGLTAGSSRVVIDVDAAREVCTVRAVSGLTISVLCKQAHSGTYPVEVESGLTIVRGVIADLESLDQVQRANFGSAGVKRVDEIEFFSVSEGGSILVQAEAFRNVLRARLASALGVTALLRDLAARVRPGAATLEVY